jgi:hypothetical protein
MDATNLVQTISLAALVYTNSSTLTNWISLNAWRHAEDGTNYVSHRMYSITERVDRFEVVPVVTYRTNTTLLKLTRVVLQGTNAPVIEIPSGFGQPPLPGVVTSKE